MTVEELCKIDGGMLKLQKGTFCTSFFMYVLSFFKKGDTIQGETVFKGGGALFKEIQYLILN